MTVLPTHDENDVNAAIGERVHNLIWQQRRRQNAVARAVGVTSSVMSKKLRGESSWSAEQVARAAALLGVTVGYLYGETAPNTGPDGPGRGNQTVPGPNVNFGWSKRSLSGAAGKIKNLRATVAA